MSTSQTTRSNPALTPPTGDSKRILQYQGSFRTEYRRKGPGQFDEIKQEPIHTLEQAFDSLDRKGPLQSVTTRPLLAPAVPNVAKKSDPHLCEQLRSMIAQEVRNECVKRFHEATQRPVENAHLDLIITGIAEIEEKLKPPFSSLD